MVLVNNLVLFTVTTSPSSTSISSAEDGARVVDMTIDCVMMLAWTLMSTVAEVTRVADTVREAGVGAKSSVNGSEGV